MRLLRYFGRMQNWQNVNIKRQGEWNTDSTFTLQKLLGVELELEGTCTKNNSICNSYHVPQNHHQGGLDLCLLFTLQRAARV